MGGIQYQRLDDETKKSGNTAYKPLQDWTTEEKTLLAALTKGDTFVVNKKEVEYTTAEGTTNTTWRLVSIAPKDTFTPKEKKEFKKKGSWSGGGSQDNISAKIGGLAHDAVAMLGVGATATQVGEVIRDLLREVLAIEEEVKAGAFKKTVQPVDVETEPTEVEEFGVDPFNTLEEIPW